MFGTRIMAQKPHSTPKSENCRRSMSLPLTAWVDSNNSPWEHDRELFEPSKDSWSLVVCTAKKKNFWDLGLGFSEGVDRERVGFAFFGSSFITPSPGQWDKIVAQNLVVFKAGIRIFRALDQLPGVSDGQIIPRRPQIVGECAEWS